MSAAHNPEFQRQLWLNWHPSLPPVPGLSLLIPAMPLALSSPKDLPGSLSMTAIAGVWVAAIATAACWPGAVWPKKPARTPGTGSACLPCRRARWPGASCWARPCPHGCMCCGLRWPRQPLPSCG